MTCPRCKSTVATARRDRTALGCRRFRCRAYRRGFNERTGTLFNHLEYSTDVGRYPARVWLANDLVAALERVVGGWHLGADVAHAVEPPGCAQPTGVGPHLSGRQLRAGGKGDPGWAKRGSARAAKGWSWLMGSACRAASMWPAPDPMRASRRTPSWQPCVSPQNAAARQPTGAGGGPSRR